MDYIKEASVIIYYLGFLVFFKRAVPFVKSGRNMMILSVLPVAAFLAYLDVVNLGWMDVPLLLVSMTLGFRYLFRMNWLQACFGGSTCVLSGYCIYGILSVIIGFLRFESPAHWASRNLINYGMAFLVLTTAFLLLSFLHKTIFQDHRLQLYLNSDKQVKVGLVFEAIELCLLVTASQWYEASETDELRMMVLIITSLVVPVTLIIYIYISIQSLELWGCREDIKRLEEQYQRQIKHYQTYQQDVKMFRAFKHDYQSMMASLQNLIQEKQYGEAIQLLGNMNDTMFCEIRPPGKYTDNIILDAMLQDLEEVCKKKGIRYSFKIPRSGNVCISVMDNVRVCSNIMNNALEACINVPEEERFIEITCMKVDAWVTLQAVNSYRGKRLMKDGVFHTTKQEGDHGLGLNIVKQIAEKSGGFVVSRIDPIKEEFMIRVHIPNA